MTDTWTSWCRRLLQRSVWALMGDGAGGFGPKTLVWSQAANGVTIGDLNRDGHNDLVLLRYNGGMSLVLGHGDGTFGPSTDYPGNFSTGPDPRRQPGWSVPISWPTRTRVRCR